MIINETQKITPNFRTILESTDDIILAIDKDYKLLYCNESLKRTLKLFLDIEIKEGDILSEYSEFYDYKDFAPTWESIFNKSFAKQKCSRNINFNIGDKQFSYKLRVIPIVEHNEVDYIQITAREEIQNYLPEDERETLKAELLTNKEDLIKERDNAVKLLLDNTERLQMVMEGSDDIFWDWDFENDSIFYSQNHKKIFGYNTSKSENNFNTWRERIHQEDVDKVLDTLLAHMEGETEQYNCEYRIKTFDGEWKWVLDKAKVVIRDAKNHPLRVSGTISEITQRKETELILKESEERFIQMSNDLPVMIWVSDRKLRVTYQNSLTSEFLGSEEEGDRSIIDLIVHPDDAEFLKYYFKDIFRTQEKASSEIRLKNSKGEYRWILMTVVPRVLDNNNMIGFLGVGVDITERKYAEMQLLDSETQFNEITSVIGEGIFVIDEKGHLQFTNPEFKKLLGWKKEELEGKIIAEFIKTPNENNESESNCAIQSVLETGERIRITEDYFLNIEGDKIPVAYVAAPIKRGGKIVGCVTAFHDITEQKKINEETKRYVKELKFNKELMRQNAMETGRMNEMLRESEDRLKELNGSKDKFFSIISHDLRSPFTSITGFSEVMMEDIDTLSKEEIKDFASSIHKTSKNVYNLLENLLQWSRIQTGRIEFSPNTLFLNELVEEIIALYQVNAARKKITLLSDLEDDCYIKADKFMLNTILRNLISNSIKFTKQGGEITIVAKEFKEENKIEISVEDTGVGMTKEIQEKLFKIDEHVTTKGTDKEKGTGIGLILCKEFVEKHEGEIWIESEIGVGSKFKFTLQLSK